MDCRQLPALCTAHSHIICGLVLSQSSAHLHIVVAALHRQNGRRLEAGLALHGACIEEGGHLLSLAVSEPWSAGDPWQAHTGLWDSRESGKVCWQTHVSFLAQ